MRQSIVLTPLLTASLVASSLFVSSSASAIQATEADTAPSQQEVESYRDAAYRWASAGSPCAVSPQVIQAVAGHASNEGDIDGHSFDADGRISPSLFGEPSNGGVGLSEIADTDAGELDLDPVWDRPIGPFQILPTSWERYGTDANNDGVTDPQNIWDSSAAAASFLCAMGAGAGQDLGAALVRYTGRQSTANAVLARIDELDALPSSKLRTSMIARSDDAPAGRDQLIVLSDAGENEQLDGLLESDQYQYLFDPTLFPTADMELVVSEMEDLGALLESARVSEDADGELIVVPFDPIDSGVIRGDWNGDGSFNNSLFTGISFIRAGAEVITFGEPGDIPLAGDWDGDGVATPGVFRLDGDDTDELRSGHFIAADANGNYYGSRIIVENAQGVTPLVGDWTGDGIESLAIRRPHDDDHDIVQFFDSFGDPSLPDVEVEANAIVLTGTEAVSNRLLGIVVEDPEPQTQSLSIERTVLAPDGAELELVRVGDIVVAIEVADQVEAMLDAAADDGLLLTGWGWRSHERQIELRHAHCADAFETPSSQCSPPTARPGTSRHEFGVAIDFHVEGRAIGSNSPIFAWLTENAATYGFFNLPSESWHWSIDGR